MKKILYCMTALVLMMTACNNKSEEQSADKQAKNDNTRNEMPVASPEDAEQSEWIKQTTIMTSKPMVIDFFATWCGPCKELAPILDEIEKKHEGEVIFKRIDIDQEPEMTQEFGIEAVPTLMFVTPKGEYQTMLGVQSPETIEAKITDLLKRSAK